MKTNFQVNNMKCGGCKATVIKTLGKASGVEDVAVDLELKQVTVSGEFDTQDIIDRINTAGFEVVQ